MKIKSKFLVGVIFLLTSLSAISQNIVSGEYFWDADPGLGNGTLIEVVDSENIVSNTSIQATGLTSGLHNLHIRVKDASNVWSHYNTILVMITNEVIFEIEEAEYFWDTDPGVGNGTSIDVNSSASIVGQVSISDNLSEGIHYLHIRVRDSQNVWSHYNRLMVIFQDNSLKEIVAMEYFWDTDPGVGNATAVDLSDGITFDGDASISTAGLSIGAHNLYIRILDETNVWSHYKLVTFTICETLGATASFATIYSGGNIVATSTGEFATGYSWTLDDAEIGTSSTVTVTTPNGQELCLVASNSCGTSIYCEIVGAPELISVNPNSVPNNLTQTIECIGLGFDETASVSIEKDGETIEASSVTFNSPQSLSATFNFSFETIGLWDVLVLQETTLTLPQSLELTTWIGVSENKMENKLAAPFPNPTIDEIQLPYSFAIASDVYITITDELGRVVESRKAVLSGNGTVRFSLKNYASGVYFVQFKSGEDSGSFKIVR
jgi:hypothetical protein